MVLLDQVETAVVVVIIENDEQAPELTTLMISNRLENHGQILIGQDAGQAGDSLDEGQCLGPGTG